MNPGRDLELISRCLRHQRHVLSMSRFTASGGHQTLYRMDTSGDFEVHRTDLEILVLYNSQPTPSASSGILSPCFPPAACVTTAHS